MTTTAPGAFVGWTKRGDGLWERAVLGRSLSSVAAAFLKHLHETGGDGTGVILPSDVLPDPPPPRAKFFRFFGGHPTPPAK